MTMLHNPGDMVYRPKFTTFLYEDHTMKNSASLIMEADTTIAIVLEVMPEKYIGRGRSIPEKIKLLHPDGKYGWGYSTHYQKVNEEQQVELKEFENSFLNSDVG